MSDESPSGNALTESRRREVFAALIEAQDHEMPVAQSKKAVAERYGITEAQVRQIEREGLDNQWPPLDEDAG